MSLRFLSFRLPPFLFSPLMLLGCLCSRRPFLGIEPVERTHRLSEKKRCTKTGKRRRRERGHLPSCPTYTHTHPHSPTHTHALLNPCDSAMPPFFFSFYCIFFFRFTVHLICHASFVYKASVSLVFRPFPYFYVSVFVLFRFLRLYFAFGFVGRFKCSFWWWWWWSRFCWVGGLVDWWIGFRNGGASGHTYTSCAVSFLLLVDRLLLWPLF